MLFANPTGAVIAQAFGCYATRSLPAKHDPDKGAGPVHL